MRLLTLTDLYNYYSSSSKSAHFKAEDEQTNIIVQVPGQVKFEENNKDTEGLLPVVLQSCHTEENVNHSFISESVMTEALPSFSNRPILGYIHEVDGQLEFYGHNMHEDEDGEIVYDEKCIGIIPESCNATLEYDEEKDKTYCVVNGYIFEEYSKAAEILKREKECSVSVELTIRELSYDAKTKILNIDNFFFSGVTILGKKDNGEKVMPGMEGSNIKLADFSKNSNSMFTNKENEMIAMLEELKTKIDSLSNYTINTTEKGGNEMLENETSVNEEFEETEDVVSEDVETIEDEAEVETEETVDESNDSDDTTPEVVETCEGENYTKTFEVSHEDIRCALYVLLSTYEETDNEYYYITDVYDSYFVYESWCGDKIFGQNYKVDGDDVSFEGERYNLHKVLLTDSEYADLQEMRKNYSVLEEQVKTYQASEEKSKKVDLMASDDYKIIKNSEEYENLVQLVNEDKDELTFDELKDKCDQMLLEYAKSGQMSSIESIGTSKVASKQFVSNFNNTKKKSRYGSLFSTK